MTSFGADNIVSMQGFCPTFTIQEQIYHTIGSLLPATNTQPKFLQVYFMGDKEAQVNRRSEYVQGVERNTVQKIQQVLHDQNILVHEFKMAKDRVTSDNYKVVIHPDRVPRGEYERRFNAPTTNEIATVVVSNERTASQDIVIQAHDGRLTRVPDTHRFYDALEYPIIFWKGQEGYSFDIPHINPFTKQPIPNKKVSCKDFYAYHIMVRHNNFKLLLRCRLLFHQFLVDMYVKVESERLRFITLSQTKLRAENYIHLQDAIRNDADLDPNSLGQMVILPLSFVNSARYFHEYTQDAFTYVRNYGMSDLFITMTYNPAWPEITRELIPGQNSKDRHDLIARVFKVKVQKLVALLTKGKIFGDMKSFMYSIEWQKRGLPQVHLLLWLMEKLCPNQIDEVISAEIPNLETYRKLYDIVTKNMIHGPCGALNPSSSCMKEGKCTKKYPRGLLKDSKTNDKDYPLYRSRAPEDGGHTLAQKT
ncbi:ATP-dependent DNA helicase [Trichonephila clavipes]|nr:ATP-dependent DNA helicase [Trichonephila clavipes]